MAPWWSPLSDGIQWLVGRTAPQRPDAPAGPVADVPAVRPPQTWSWQPPIQRAVDPTWQPGLRPDDFAAGLTSHQDPSLRRDLVHDVRPSTGGLVDGLADLVPGPPRTREATSELTVRPVRPSRPAVQRSLASFASASAVEDGVVPGGDDLTTVEVEPPWSADPVRPDEPVRPVEPVKPAEPTDTAASVGPVVTTPNASESVPAGTSRDIRVQRHELPAVSPAGPSETPDAFDEPAMPVAPTVARTTADGPTVPRAGSGAVPTDGVRTLPVVAGAPPARPAAPELPTTRTLPVLQRSVASTGDGPAPSPSRSDSSPAPSWPEATAPEPTSTEAAAPRSRKTAPLSGFAEAIDRMSREPEPEPESGVAPVQRAAEESAVAGPVVPQGRPSSPGREGTPGSVWSTSLPSPGVQRATTVEAAEAPLLGSRVEDVPPVEPAMAQRAAYDDLPVVPVARDGEPNHGWAGPDDVPRLPVVTDAPASVATSGSTGVPSHRDEASPTVARAVQVRIPTAPLTGTRRAMVQRSRLEPPQHTGTPATGRVQPLRYERFEATTTTPASSPAASITARASVPTEPSLQRSANSFPTVAPGLPGAGPVVPGLTAHVTGGPALRQAQGTSPTSVAADPVPALPAVVFPAPGSPTVDLEPVSLSRSVDQSTWSPPEPIAARPTAAAPPGTARSLPFDQMFGGTGAPGTSDGDVGWTTVDLPVIRDAPAVVQRAVGASEVSAEPVAPEPAAPPPDVAATSPPTAAAPAGPAPAAVPGAADLDEMARRLFDPLSARLKAELWLDRERAGLVADAHF